MFAPEPLRALTETDTPALVMQIPATSTAIGIATTATTTATHHPGSAFTP